MLLYTVGVGGVAYVYLRIFKGWRLSDLMYVTRSSLSRSMSSVTAGRRPPPITSQQSQPGELPNLPCCLPYTLLTPSNMPG